MKPLILYHVPLYPPPYIHDYRCEAGEEEAVNCYRCMLHHIMGSEYTRVGLNGVNTHTSSGRGMHMRTDALKRSLNIIISYYHTDV